MKEGAPQLAKYNHEFALEGCEHSLWPLHCRPEEEVNGAQERLAQAVWIKHNVRGCCQSEYRRVACGLATWTQIESRVTLLVPIGVPGHMLEHYGGTAIQGPLAPEGRGDRQRPTSQGQIGTKDPVITRTKVVPLGGRQIGGAHTVACMCPGQGTNQVLVPLRPEDFAQQAIPLPVPS